MIALAAAVKDHWHAVERDLLDLGYHADDIGVNLSVCELISIVVAAPQNSAIYDSDPTRWTRTDELLANLSEQQAGVLGLNARYARPQVDPTPVRPARELEGKPYGGVPLEARPVEQWQVELKERQRIARENAAADRVETK